MIKRELVYWTYNRPAKHRFTDSKLSGLDRRMIFSITARLSGAGSETLGTTGKSPRFSSFLKKGEPLNSFWCCQCEFASYQASRLKTHMKIVQQMLPMPAWIWLWGWLMKHMKIILPAPKGVVGADGDEPPLMIQGCVWTEAPPSEKNLWHNAR